MSSLSSESATCSGHKHRTDPSLCRRCRPHQTPSDPPVLQTTPVLYLFIMLVSECILSPPPSPGAFQLELGRGDFPRLPHPPNHWSQLVFERMLWEERLRRRLAAGPNPPHPLAVFSMNDDNKETKVNRDTTAPPTPLPTNPYKQPNTPNPAAAAPPKSLQTFSCFPPQTSITSASVCSFTLASADESFHSLVSPPQNIHQHQRCPGAGVVPQSDFQYFCVFLCVSLLILVNRL